MKKAYVIGKNASKSLSPTIFNYWFKKHNIKGQYGFKEIDESDFSNIIPDVLKEKGIFCCKLIRGKGEEELVKIMRVYFSEIKRFKPDASRKDSAEIFLIGLNFNNQNLA